MHPAMTEKFWFINNLQTFLTGNGISAGVSNIITFCSAVILLFIFLRLLDIVGNKLIINIVHHAVRKSSNKWDDLLLERHFFRRILRFIFAVILIFFIETVFTGFSPKLIKGASAITKCLAIFFILKALAALLDVVNDIYMTLPRFDGKSIKGYVQSAKIIFYIIGAMAAISLIFNIPIGTLLVSLATSAAILTLVFKDTILGFIASIQLAAQDMVRLGDWIEMKSKGADGTVIDINVTTVKVQNWDNTITMIPIYSMVSESFINWRAMENSAGRRFKRPFLIDLNSVKTVTDEELEQYRTLDTTSQYFDEIMEEKNMFSPSETTNLSLFRAYLNIYLKHHKNVNSELTLLVRYLPMTDNGLTIEIYGFTKQRRFTAHEAAMNEITEHIVAATRIFGIQLYQRSSNFQKTNTPDEDSLPTRAD